APPQDTTVSDSWALAVRDAAASAALRANAETLVVVDLAICVLRCLLRLGCYSGLGASCPSRAWLSCGSQARAISCRGASCGAEQSFMFFTASPVPLAVSTW